MTKEIENKIITKCYETHPHNPEHRYIFIEGANWALSHPELMRETMEDFLNWVGIHGWRFNDDISLWYDCCSDDNEEYPPSYVFNLYLEHLKQKV